MVDRIRYPTVSYLPFVRITFVGDTFEETAKFEGYLS